MPLALDAVAFSKTNPGTSITAAGAVAVVATGDSFTIRNFPQTAMCRLVGVTRTGATAGAVRITSPMLHDNVRGIQFETSESPSVFLMPRDIGQPMIAEDTLAVSVSGGTNEIDGGVMFFHYTDLLGASARLKMWSDISGMIRYIKPVQVAISSQGGSDAWVDTALNATEDLMHANKDYAVLGYMTDAACAAVGVKGIETGNLRVCGPGPTSTLDITDIFITLSERLGLPYIPIINSANKQSIFVSMFAPVAAISPNIQLILAELVQNLPT